MANIHSHPSLLQLQSDHLAALTKCHQADIAYLTTFPDADLPIPKVQSIASQLFATSFQNFYLYWALLHKSL